MCIRDSYYEKYQNAVDVINDNNPLEVDVEKATKELNEALNKLVRVASKEDLSVAIAQATVIYNAVSYTPLGRGNVL